MMFGHGSSNIKSSLQSEFLKIDPPSVTEQIVKQLRNALKEQLHRRGLVLGVSGGIDSSVCAALAVRAIGKDKVFALEMPEKDSDPDSLRLSTLLISQLGIESSREDITAPLVAMSYYRRYSTAVKQVVPDYTDGWTSKIVSEQGGGDGLRYFSLVARSPGGSIYRKRLRLKTYLEIVAATNFKQRIRKMFEYYHADRLHYAVIGTPNRLEYDQGFFVKGGDGSADVKPIAHLYKSQVYQLAEYLDIPAEICARPPTTDTYSLSQGQDEFYFNLPYQQMDLCLYGKNHDIPVEQVAEVAQMEKAHVVAAYDDIQRKRNTTRYLHLSPLLVEPVLEAH